MHHQKQKSRSISFNFVLIWQNSGIQIDQLKDMQYEIVGPVLASELNGQSTDQVFV